MNKKRAFAINLVYIISAAHIILCSLTKVGSTILGLILKLLTKGGISMSLNNQLSIFLNFLPIVLFLVYMFFFYKKQKTHFLLPVSFVAAAILNCFSVPNSLSVIMTQAGDIPAFFKFVTSAAYIIGGVLLIILSLATIAVFAFWAYDSFMKFRYLDKSRLLSLGLVGICVLILFINVTLSAATIVASFFSANFLIIIGTILHQLFNIALAIGSSLWSAALFLFWTRCISKNRRRPAVQYQQPQNYYRA